MSLLTKSKYLNGLQCLKYLWVIFNDPEKNPSTDSDLTAQFRFEEGNKVGYLAKNLFPDGILIPDNNLHENLRLSKELLLKNKPLFEAGFMYDNVYSRVDILIPVDDDTWNIIEVKSTTKVKDEHIQAVTELI